MSRKDLVTMLVAWIRGFKMPCIYLLILPHVFSVLQESFDDYRF